MSRPTTFLVTPWHRLDVRDQFLRAWQLRPDKLPENVILEEDVGREGCAVTKNRGIQRAIDRGAEIVVVLDSDCFPWEGDEITFSNGVTLDDFLSSHERALEPVDVEMFTPVTEPYSRGTPHFPQNRRLKMPVAGSMSFWRGVGDYDAPSQIIHGAYHEMEFKRGPIFGRYFAWSGMAVAFRREWWPIAQFINVARYDDIFGGLIFQKIAFARGFCFHLGAAMDVSHSRQSNVWANMRDEAIFMEQNETLWQKVALHPSTDYAELRALLPVP